jgi:hypothetical protein
MLTVGANRRLAFIAGIVLPLAETVRRSGDLASWWLWIDDWLIGAALLFGAWAAGRGKAGGLRALAAAWGIAAGMGYYSFVGHLLRIASPDVSGLPGWTLAAAIGLGWALALYALLSALAAPEEGPAGG